MLPAPGPNTLRMGDQRFVAGHPEVPNPLQVYQRPGGGYGATATRPAASTDFEEDRR
jgi:hypothetical protein